MSYFHCAKPDLRNAARRHQDCNGYKGPLDETVCLCPCHDGKRAEDRR